MVRGPLAYTNAAIYLFPISACPIYDVLRKVLSWEDSKTFRNHIAKPDRYVENLRSVRLIGFVRVQVEPIAALCILQEVVAGSRHQLTHGSALNLSEAHDGKIAPIVTDCRHLCIQTEHEVAAKRHFVPNRDFLRLFWRNGSIDISLKFNTPLIDLIQRLPIFGLTL
jgi:hypothetical protein